MQELSAFLSVLFALLIMVVVLGLAYVTTKWLGKKSIFAGQSSSKNMKVLDRMALTQDTSLLIVQVAAQRFLLALSPQGIQKLHAFSEQDELLVEDISKDQDFVSLFKDVLKRREDKS